MDLDGPRGSEGVGRNGHRPGQPRADIADGTWPAAAGQARVDVEPAGDGAVIVRVSGELDIASAPLVEDAVRTAHVARRRHVQLDVSAVSFCDCAGLNAFLASDRLLRAAGDRLTLIRLSDPVRRLLMLTRTHRVLAVDRPLDA